MADRGPRDIRLVLLGRTAAWKTQAVYHALAERMSASAPDTIVVCRPATPYVCLGYHQSLESTLDRAACTRLNLPIFRRQVGGGATYLDSQQVFYQCIFHHSCLPVSSEQIYARLLDAPVRVLRQLGLCALLRDTNEIEIDGKRIAGIGGGRIGEASVVVGNILLDFDYERMALVWKVPSAAFRELALEGLRDHLTTLKQLAVRVDAKRAETLLAEEFARALGRPCTPGPLTDDELACAREWRAKLASKEFLSRHTPMPIRQPSTVQPLKISARVYIHFVEMELKSWRLRGSFRVNDHVIEAGRIESDPPRDWSEIEKSLAGTPFDQWRTYIEGLSRRT